MEFRNADAKFIEMEYCNGSGPSDAHVPQLSMYGLVREQSCLCGGGTLHRLFRDYAYHSTIVYSMDYVRDQNPGKLSFNIIVIS